MKNIVIIGLVLVLAGCGGVNKFKKKRGSHKPRPTISARAPSASGPINAACMASDRKARSRRLCGCIQSVANDTLSGGQQRRAVKFYSDPQAAQDIRMSDRANDEKFWKAYKEYGARARKSCS